MNNNIHNNTEDIKMEQTEVATAGHWTFQIWSSYWKQIYLFTLSGSVCKEVAGASRMKVCMFQQQQKKKL